MRVCAQWCNFLLRQRRQSAATPICTKNICSSWRNVSCKFPQIMASVGMLFRPKLFFALPPIPSHSSHQSTSDHNPPLAGEAPANEIRVAATQSLSTIIERTLEAFKANDIVVVRGLGGAISGAVQVCRKFIAFHLILIIYYILYHPPSTPLTTAGLVR
jgi:hypothetical protein